MVVADESSVKISSLHFLIVQVVEFVCDFNLLNRDPSCKVLNKTKLR